MKYDTNSTTTPKISSWWKGFWDSTGNFFARLVPASTSPGVARHLGSQIPNVTLDSRRIFLLRMKQSTPYLLEEESYGAVASSRKPTASRKGKAKPSSRSRKSAAQTRRKSR